MDLVERRRPLIGRCNRNSPLDLVSQRAGKQHARLISCIPDTCISPGKLLPYILRIVGEVIANN